MNCKECKDTRTYVPLIGPPETCRACQLASDTNISHNMIYPIASLCVTFKITNDQLNHVIDNIKHHESVGCNIKVNAKGEVIQGGPTVLALRQLKNILPLLYKKLVPGNMLNVTMCDAQYSEELGRVVDDGDSIADGKNKIFAMVYGGDESCTLKDFTVKAEYASTTQAQRILDSKRANVAKDLIAATTEARAKDVAQGIKRELRRPDKKTKMVAQEEEETSNPLDNITRETVYMRQRAATLVSSAKGPPPEDWSILRKAMYRKLQNTTIQLEQTAIIARQLSNKLGWAP